QPSSSSEPHAAQLIVVRFCPQCGQKVMARPTGSNSLQARQRSPACGTILLSVLDGGAAGRSGGSATGTAALTRSSRCGSVGNSAAMGPGTGALGAAAALALFARSGMLGVLSNARTAPGDNEICASANCRNAPGSGFRDASSARS